MTSEALQNPYFVWLYCKNIDKTHSLTEPNDTIQFHGNYFFKKKGGNHFGKGGGDRPPVPPPPKSALGALAVNFIGHQHNQLKVYLITKYIPNYVQNIIRLFTVADVRHN